MYIVIVYSNYISLLSKECHAWLKQFVCCHLFDQSQSWITQALGKLKPSGASSVKLPVELSLEKKLFETRKETWISLSQP